MYIYIAWRDVAVDLGNAFLLRSVCFVLFGVSLITLAFVNYDLS
jgi:hypothetical protein